MSVFRAAVLVQSPEGLAIEWYDIDTGMRLGRAPVAPSTAWRLSTDGRFVAFAAGAAVRVLDLETGRQRLVAKAEGKPVGLSVQAGRLVWGENARLAGRIVTAVA
jgi:hypothetical protein